MEARSETKCRLVLSHFGATFHPPGCPGQPPAAPCGPLRPSQVPVHQGQWQGSPQGLWILCSPPLPYPPYQKSVQPAAPFLQSAVPATLSSTRSCLAAAPGAPGAVDIVPPYQQSATCRTLPAVRGPCFPGQPPLVHQTRDCRSYAPPCSHTRSLCSTPYPSRSHYQTLPEMKKRLCD